MRFSLLLATLNRTRETRQFLDSLAAQTWRDFELIVIDQNADARLDSVIEPYRGQFEIRHLHCARGHSRAINLGLAHASGDVVAFPDDDCWYDPNLLAKVAAYLGRKPRVSGVTGREVVEPGFTSGSRWDRRGGPITRTNIWKRAITFTIFLRTEAAAEAAFDETLGVGAGSPWGAGEETDYLLRLLGAGHAIDYDPSLTIWHQGRNGPYTSQSYAKARHYAAGIGRVMRMNRYPFPIVLYHLLRPVGGVALSLLRGRADRAEYHWSIFRGRVAGWTAAPPPVQATVAVPGPEANI